MMVEGHLASWPIKDRHTIEAPGDQMAADVAGSRELQRSGGLDDGEHA
jgi:hypothetical protein